MRVLVTTLALALLGSSIAQDVDNLTELIVGLVYGEVTEEGRQEIEITTPLDLTVVASIFEAKPDLPSVELARRGFRRDISYKIYDQDGEYIFFVYRRDGPGPYLYNAYDSDYSYPQRPARTYRVRPNVARANSCQSTTNSYGSSMTCYDSRGNVSYQSNCTVSRNYEVRCTSSW
jgi:hypothetical protein